jgi:apolipoprotein N-acyltransferase
MFSRSFEPTGLVLAATLPGLLAWRPKPIVPLAALLITIANVSYHARAPKRPWIGVDVVSTGDSSMIGDFERIQFVLDRAAAEPGKTLVFPEATVRSWTPTTFEFFVESIRAIRANGTTVLLGVLVPEVPDESRTPAYRNVVLKIGSSIEIVDQRVPVPFGMWKPFGRAGVHLHAFGDGIVNSGDERSAVLICYEQLIPWPAVVSTFSSPALAVGISNTYWVGGTSVPQLQIAYLKAWATLWRAPVITATAR